jgi:DNA phosphorothioation system restriction enzyme
MGDTTGDFSKLSILSFVDTSTHDLTKDLFTPLLSNAVFYDRGVGYFSSGWLRANCEGMAQFAANGGRARWITSPILDERDWEALLIGDAARTSLLLLTTLERNITTLSEALQKDVLNALAWLVADEVLTFKLAVPRNKLANGEFHDKFGIFTDGTGNKVSFNGSYNDSIQGTRNYESLKVFSSWETALTSFVQADATRFEKLWNNEDPNVQVFDLPLAAQEKIVKLRTAERPYPEPKWVRIRRLYEAKVSYNLPCPHLPEKLDLRDYQREAIDAWFTADCQGFLEMATGTGKTITALAASVRLLEQQKRLAVIIAVPFQHLVDQWHTEAKEFGYLSVLAYQSKTRWLKELNEQISEFKGGYRSHLSVITTHATFISSDFQKVIGKLDTKTLLIADEAHHLGAEESRKSYPLNIPFRLALSATPNRWFDDYGTAQLREYFGETVYAFPLEKAINVSLTPYYYYPHLVELTLDEMHNYQELTDKIARIIHYDDENSQRTVELLLIKRSSILYKAENKLAVLSNLVDQPEDIRHTLFYCAPEQIKAVRSLIGWEKGIKVKQFTAEENPQERKTILEDFASGTLQGLVAMKCLDEGVDVPNTRTAFILASSSNPREFIQRRGRILRKAPGKTHSFIHDFIVMPPAALSSNQSSPTFQVDRKIIRRELQRFKEFSNVAENKQFAIDVIWGIARQYGLRDF